MKSLISLRSSLKPSDPTADDGRVAKEIRRCLDLVQTCHQDLQHLIELRNEHLKFLETAPQRVLERINRVIDSANQGLVEGRRIVEKCRPKEHRGMKMTLHNRAKWILRSSVDFRGQEPVMIRHNAAVLAELSYLRQITTRIVLGNIPTTNEDPAVKPLHIGRGTNKTGMVSTSATAITVASTPSSRATTPKIIEYCDLPEAVFPDALPGMTPSNVASAAAHVTTHGDDSNLHRIVLGPSDDQGLSLLFGD